MEIRVLGTVEIVHAGNTVDLSSRRQYRIIIGILALEATKLVPTQRLVDLMWDGDPPTRARTTLQVRVSELRAILGDQLGDVYGRALKLSNTPTGYRLDVSPALVDVHRFRQLAVQASETSEPDRRRDLLRQAMELWRGSAFGGERTSTQFASVVQALQAERLTAQEDLFEAELQCSAHRAVVDQIAELASQHPERERLHRQLMLALHRSGRTQEALRAYSTYQARLSRELGIDPGSDIAALHVAILKDDASLKAPSPEKPRSTSYPNHFVPAAPQILPPDIVDFVGRTTELRHLRQALATPRAGTVPVVSISGPGGVGKTALATHLAHQLQTDYPDGQLYIDLHGASTAARLDTAGVLSRFLHALGVDDMAAPESFEERVDLYRDLLSRRHILVVLDNVADDEQILPLIPGSATCAVIVTGRTRVGLTFGAQIFDLPLLPHREASELLSRIAGEERVRLEPEATQELVQYSGLMPLALRIVGARLAARPQWRVKDLVDLLKDQRRRLDQLAYGRLDIRESILLSYKSLQSGAKQLLRQLAQLDQPEISAWTSAPLLDASKADAEASLNELSDARLIEPWVAGADTAARYRLHDLVRLFAHQRADDEDGDHASRLARSRTYRSWLTAIDTAYRALFGGSYRTVHSDEPRYPIDDPTVLNAITHDPVEWFSQERHNVISTIHQAARDGAIAACWDLACSSSALFQMCRVFGDWQIMLTDAIRFVTADRDPRGHAALLYRQGWLFTDRTQLPDAQEALERSTELFRECGDRHGEALGLAYTAMVYRYQQKPELALQTFRRAQPMLHEEGDVETEAFTLRSIGQVHLASKEYDLAEANLLRAFALTPKSGMYQGEAQISFWLGMLRLDQDRLDEAHSYLDAALTVCQRNGDRPGQAQCLRGLGIAYHRRGDRQHSDALLEQALRLVQQPRSTHLERRIRATIDELASSP